MWPTNFSDHKYMMIVVDQSMNVKRLASVQPMTVDTPVAICGANEVTEMKRVVAVNFNEMLLDSA